MFQHLARPNRAREHIHMTQAVPNLSRIADSVRNPSRTEVRPISAMPPMRIPPGGLNPFFEAPQTWIVYDICDTETGKHYVGLTKLALKQRVRGHIQDSLRRKIVRPGGLLARLRELGVNTVESFNRHFTTRIVGQAATPEHAAIVEAIWVAKQNSAAPHGLNLMPGGASVGGTLNAKSVSVQRGSLRKVYRSIGAAVAHANIMAGPDRRELKLGTVHARLVSGWPPEEALGYEKHEDRRGSRAPFKVRGRTFTRISAASAAFGMKPASIRSRIHSAEAASTGRAAPLEIGWDRRRDGLGKLPQLGLRHPATGEPVSARQYAEATGLPTSTVIHRVKRLGIAAGTPEAMGCRVERRRWVRLATNAGRIVEGGEREVVRHVLADDEIQKDRVKLLSAEGIRARLRRLTQDERNGPACVRWACGLLGGDRSYAEMRQARK